MSEKLVFIARHYGSLLLFATAFFGFGNTALYTALKVSIQDTWLRMVMSISTGIVVFAVAFQLIAISGGINRSNVNLLLTTGILLSLLAVNRRRNALPVASNPLNTFERIGIFVLLLMLVPTLLAPLSPPHKWDEVMYHLPHAQQWAESGRLQVNDWLRYPWAPYNLNLLYSAGLIIRGDVFPHLLHALTGWLIAIMVYRIGVIHTNHLTACLATFIWFRLTNNEYDAALVDLGVSLSIFSAFIAFYFWIRNPQTRRWLFVSSCLLGMAMGSKYQALSSLPLFVAAVLFTDRKAGTLLISAIGILIPCGYWYIRNYLYTGDPFDPLGGPFFGFSDWNIGDMQYQLSDLKRSANWPDWPLGFAVLSPFFKRIRDNPFFRVALFFSAYSFAVWYMTSHYDRYLLPAYPILAIVSARAIQEIYHKLSEQYNRMHFSPIIAQVVGVAILGIVLLASVKSYGKKLDRYWSRICVDEQSRTAFLNQTIVAYSLMREIKKNPHRKIYQLGLEGAIYYAPHPIWGDHFGPWRYRDVSDLDPKALAAKLRSENFDTLLVHFASAPELEAKPEFRRYFAVFAEQDGNKAYQILSPTDD